MSAFPTTPTTTTTTTTSTSSASSGNADQQQPTQQQLYYFMAPSYDSPDAVHPYSVDPNTPLVIDNGAYTVKAGWGGENRPRMHFPNQMVRARPKQNDGPTVLVGNDANVRMEGVDILRKKKATPFMDGVPARLDVQEVVLDHIVTHLMPGVERVTHPVVFTEPVAMPSMCRANLSELLFECFQVPSVCYAIDSLLARYYHHGGKPPSAGVAVGIGETATHVLPIWDSRLRLQHAKRISVGGYDMTNYMEGLLTAYYPLHASYFTEHNIKQLLHSHTYIAHDYDEELVKLEDPAVAEPLTRTIQLPFVPLKEVSEEEKQRMKEDLRERGRKLQEKARKQRLDRLEKKESYLDTLNTIREMKDENKRAFKKMLTAEGFDSEAALSGAITSLEETIRDQRRRLFGEEEESSEDSESEPDEVAYPLLNIPDSELTANERKEKKRQQFVRNMKLGRKRAAEEKAARLAAEEEKRKAMEEARKADPEGWLRGLRLEREKILKAQAEKERKKEQLQDRRSQASRQRMSMLLQQTQAGDDDFGMRDDDWDVYRDLAGGGDSDEEEAESQRLVELETLLVSHDPNHMEAEKRDPAKEAQVPLCVERMRIPETLFKPALLGSRQSGLVETIELVLRRFDAATQAAMVADIVISGGPAAIPGLRERVVRDVRMIRPMESEFSVSVVDEPTLAAWIGASMFTRDAEFETASITRELYEEAGHDYLAEHSCSNRYA